MCMLSFIPGGVEIEEQDLLNGGIINGDGSGWAIAAGDHIEMGKSMKVEEALDEFIAARKQYPDSDALFHSRWATHGTTGIANVHPFPVGTSDIGSLRFDGHKTVMAHNGILPCKPDKDDWRSDTRILADDYLTTKYKRFDKPGAMKALETYIGRNNKLCILTVDPRYKKTAYLVNEKAGVWDEYTGVWHSNYDYIGRSAKYGTGSYGPYWSKNAGGVWTKTYPQSTKEWSRNGQCLYCGWGAIGKAGFCLECGTCEDCGAYRTDCQCYAGYYKTFDWDQTVIGRKALESGTAASCGVRNVADATVADGVKFLDEAQAQ